MSENILANILVELTIVIDKKLSPNSAICKACEFREIWHVVYLIIDTGMYIVYICNTVIAYGLKGALEMYSLD